MSKIIPHSPPVKSKEVDEKMEINDIKEEVPIQNGYKCYYCDIFFSIKGNLKRHQIGSCTSPR